MSAPIVPVSSSWRIRRDGWAVPLAGAEYERQEPSRQLKARKAESQRRIRARNRARGRCACGCPLDRPGRKCSICLERARQAYQGAAPPKPNHCRVCGEPGHNARTCPEARPPSGRRPLSSTGAAGSGPPGLRNGPQELGSGWGRDHATLGGSDPGSISSGGGR